MRYVRSLLVILLAVIPLQAQAPDEGPTNDKARKSYEKAVAYVKDHMTEAALDEFKKADKQDDGHCRACQKEMIKYGISFQDWKAAETAAQELVDEAKEGKDVALAHYQFSIVLMDEAFQKHKDEYFSRAHEELGKALAVGITFPDAVYNDGRALAHLKQDDEAKARFEQYVKIVPEGNPQRRRALRYISQPELARARMAPPFAITTSNGQQVSLDDLQGKVVLLDFWATWCGPCREALPHIQKIAQKFQGQPLVILSISLDADEQKWKDFIEKNEMTWSQYRDGGFTGPVASMFGVKAIPHTFTIDADGVLQDEQIGDASIEGKLKKLVAHANELQAEQKPGQAAN